MKRRTLVLINKSNMAKKKGTKISVTKYERKQKDGVDLANHFI